MLKLKFKNQGFRSKPRNYSVRSNTRGSTEAQGKAIIWAYQALADAKTLDRYHFPVVRKGSIEGQFSFYHYCDDAILSVRYDRSAGVWYAKVQREIIQYIGSPSSLLYQFEIAIIAA